LIVRVPVPPGAGGPCPTNREGDPDVYVTRPLPFTVPSCPVAVAELRVPGALLRVKEMSLSACPELLIVAALRVFISVTLSWPAEVENTALAESGPSDPLPLEVNVIDVA